MSPIRLARHVARTHLNHPLVPWPPPNSGVRSSLSGNAPLRRSHTHCSSDSSTSTTDYDRNCLLRWFSSHLILLFPPKCFGKFSIASQNSRVIRLLNVIEFAALVQLIVYRFAICFFVDLAAARNISVIFQMSILVFNFLIQFLNFSFLIFDFRNASSSFCPFYSGTRLPTCRLDYTRVQNVVFSVCKFFWMFLLLLFLSSYVPVFVRQKCYEQKRIIVDDPWLF